MIETPKSQHASHGHTMNGCLRWRVQVAREQIGYLRFLLEGYEGLAQLLAVRGREEVTLLVPASRAEECRALLQALADEIGLCPLETPDR